MTYLLITGPPSTPLPVTGPPVTYPPGGGGGGGNSTPCPPPPPSSPTCPAESLKLGACVDLLGGLVHVGLGDPVVNQCCPVLEGAGGAGGGRVPVLLCTTIKLKAPQRQPVPAPSAPAPPHLRQDAAAGLHLHRLIWTSWQPPAHASIYP